MFKITLKRLITLVKALKKLITLVKEDNDRLQNQA